jgi:hypothetical protein
MLFPCHRLFLPLNSIEFLLPCNHLFGFFFWIACHRCKKKLCSKYTRKYQADLHESKQLRSNILKSRSRAGLLFTSALFWLGKLKPPVWYPGQPEVSCPEVEPKYLARKWYCFLHLSWNLVEDWSWIKAWNWHSLMDSQDRLLKDTNVSQKLGFKALARYKNDKFCVSFWEKEWSLVSNF